MRQEVDVTVHPEQLSADVHLCRSLIPPLGVKINVRQVMEIAQMAACRHSTRALHVGHCQAVFTDTGLIVVRNHRDHVCRANGRDNVIDTALFGQQQVSCVNRILQGIRTAFITQHLNLRIAGIVSAKHREILSVQIRVELIECNLILIQRFCGYSRFVLTRTFSHNLAVKIRFIFIRPSNLSFCPHIRFGSVRPSNLSFCPHIRFGSVWLSAIRLLGKIRVQQFPDNSGKGNVITAGKASQKHQHSQSKAYRSKFHVSTSGIIKLSIEKSF